MAMVSVTLGDDQKRVEIRVGEELTISLPENATTGYRWDVDQYDREVLELRPAQPSYPSEAVGAGGHAAFTLVGKKAGETDVALKYWRHWEGEKSIVNRFQLRAVVTA